MSSVPDESIVESGIQLPGESLLVARESQGCSQQAIADELHLPVRYIQWIEESAYEKLPSLVFARGYIRAYAKIVGIDGTALIEMFDQAEGGAAKKDPIRSVSKVQQQVKLGDPVMRWSGWLFLLMIVAAVGWWWKTQYSLAPVDGLAPVVSVVTETTGDNTLKLPTLDDAVASEELDAVAQTVEEQVGVEEPVNLSAADISKLQSELDSGVAVSPEISVVATTVEIVEAVEKLPLESAVALPLALDKLQMTFTADCWLTVKDADGKTIFNNLRKKGQSLKLSGKEPLRVLIGRVSAIDQVIYNKAVIDLKPFSSKNVAKFTLPLN
ncbi:RodZ domain-containing protein [Neptunomonas japonica]|uniref:Cytoskeleton protein RodZ n=1 Tax=Neptunomonas japonica JAMM 1380 TaxID=1441457 RepID=A0A7R6PQY0_9GAMM|nr:RodZ domain-containing protein [Neptunomonas japonica]BBB30972.1 cytoskeleton protein RodZ [Neptunomonas japonica JAMM 1380]